MQFSIALIALVAAVNAASLPRQLDGLTNALPVGDLTGAAPAAAAAVPATSDLAGDSNLLPTSMTTGEAAAKCGNGQVLSCCNKNSGDNSGSLLGGLAEDLIGGNCDQVPVNIIGANGILMDQCHPNNAACCTSEEGGLLDVPCNPISA